MEELLEALCQICGNFEPITSAQVLAIVGVVALVLVFAYLTFRAGTAAALGVGNVITGLRTIIVALALGTAAVLILYLTVCLANGALTHAVH